MQTLVRIGLGLLVLFLLIAPVYIYFRLSAMHQRYADIVTKYECLHEECAADFNGDGTAEKLVIERKSPSPAGLYSANQAWLVVNDANRELLRIPYSYVDNTLRTHAAIRPTATGSRLLIFDHDTGGQPLRQVFAWNDRQMTQVPPSTEDEKIFAALSARDDAGSWNQWVLFTSLGKPTLVAYYVLLCMVSFVMFRRLKTSGIMKQTNSEKQLRPDY